MIDSLQIQGRLRAGRVPGGPLDSAPPGDPRGAHLGRERPAGPAPAGDGDRRFTSAAGGRQRGTPADRPSTRAGSAGARCHHPAHRSAVSSPVHPAPHPATDNSAACPRRPTTTAGGGGGRRSLPCRPPARLPGSAAAAAAGGTLQPSIFQCAVGPARWRPVTPAVTSRTPLLHPAGRAPPPPPPLMHANCMPHDGVIGDLWWPQSSWPGSAGSETARLE